MCNVALAEGPLFDPVAARMLGLSSSEAAGEHSTPAMHAAPPIQHISPVVLHTAPSAPAPSVLHPLPESTPTPSLARPSVTLQPEEQKHFGPLSAGRKYDPRMLQAARIARQRAEPRMTFLCWRYVKDALVEAGVVDSRPATSFAKEAGRELCEKYGFVKLRVSDPLEAPVGAVVVYGGRDAGHVELRTENGFVSDFVSKTPYPRPLVGIFVKPVQL